VRQNAGAAVSKEKNPQSPNPSGFLYNRAASTKQRGPESGYLIFPI